MLLNAAKPQGYSFYHFWVIKRKPIGGGGITPRSRLSKVIHQADRKQKAALFNKSDTKTWGSFCLNTGKFLFVELLF